MCLYIGETNNEHVHVFIYIGETNNEHVHVYR